MWNIEELQSFLDEHQITTIQAEHLEECRYVCHLIDGDYDLEIRNETFTGSPIPPVPSVREGELVLIGAKRLATEQEIQNAMSRVKTDVHRANLEKAWKAGKKAHFDSRVSATFSRVLRNAGYLTPSGHAKAPMTPQSVREALIDVMERYLEANLPNRDELAIKLMSRDPSFIHLARDSSSSNVDFCVALVKAGHDLTLARMPRNVVNDWRFIHAVRESDIQFGDVQHLFSIEVLRILCEAAQNGTLDEVIDFQKAKAEADICFARIQKKMQRTPGALLMKH